MEKNKVNLRICGNSYSILTEDEPEYVEELGELIDKEMKSIGQEVPSLSMAQCAVLVALDQADACKKATASADNLRAQIKDYLEDSERARMIEAEWEPEFLLGNVNEHYMTTLRIFANNRTGLLVDISRIFTEREIDINAIRSRISKQEVATIEVEFGVRAKNDLRALVEKLRQLESIIDIERAAG